VANPYLKRRSWYIRYKDGDGRWRCVQSNARTKGEAKRLASEIEAREQRRRLGLEAAPTLSDDTLADLLSWWVDEYLAPSPSFSRCVGTVRNHLIRSPLGELRLADVTSGRIEGYLQGKAVQVSSETVNHLRGYLSRAFNCAIRAEKWQGENPVSKVRKRRIPKTIPDYLRAEEAPRLLAALAAKWQPLFATALYTGLRKGELLGLRKSDVDLDTRLLTVARSYGRKTTKGGHADAIPIANEVIPFLKAALERSPSDLVFPRSGGQMMSDRTQLELVLRRAIRRAGIVTGYKHLCRRKQCGHNEVAVDDGLRRCPRCNMKLWAVGVVRLLRFHHLRHSTASLLLMAGADVVAVSKILRHSDPKITSEVYGHLEPDYLRAEIDRLSLGLGTPAATGAKVSGILLPVCYPPAGDPSNGATNPRNLENASKDLSRSGREDSNLRHPAPKAGALPTALRPVSGARRRTTAGILASSSPPPAPRSVTPPASPPAP
jgi:integrase